MVAFKRRIYLWVSAAGALVTLLPWVLGLPGGLPAWLAVWAYPAATLLSASLWLLLWRGWVVFQAAERGLFMVLAALLLALQLLSNLNGEVASAQLQLSLLSVTLVAYLAYPQRQAALLSLLLFGLTLGCAVSAAVWLERPALALIQPSLQLQLGAALAQLWVALNYNRQAEQERRRSDDLYQQARRDPLTRVANRRALYEALDLALTQGHPLAVILLDLDHFKAVNDTHGHLVGDEVLCGLGALLQAQVRTGDMVGRWGGEEFLVVLPDAEPAQAGAVASRLLQAIRAQAWPAGVPLTASLGVTNARPGERHERLTERADQHLYRAKALGRNRVVGDASPGAADAASFPWAAG
jgi:diguanylate cyclase